MKKWIIGLFATTMVFSLAACGNVSDEQKDEAKSKVESAKEKASTKVGSAKQKLQTKAMDFYTGVVDKVNEVDQDYDAYIADITSDNPSKGEALNEMADKASASADKISEKLASIKVPDLGAKTDNFKASLQSLSDGFAEKAKTIKENPGDTKVVEAADAKLQQASDKLAIALESVGLSGANILNDITG
ncbi:apolipoprotein A1/A4/E family protein [Listeria booriae]|uniref:hypothetical protein n=1 Tax=Listeria booriae TaxID=1552123 RepID=UPI001625B56F|nr:hypothetical protein [Listeria booriae]MBC2369410.1 apolipoprotein A1/A4/E family protein [Listeria booriae]